MAKLIVGLGNPGKHYENTRHNVGFMALDRLAQSAGAVWKRKGKSLLCECPGATKLILLKPQTYMNLSGEAVREVCDYYKIATVDVLVVFDDLDLPPGQVKARLKGSAGGHNGVKSIIDQLGSSEFSRIKIGIGKAPSGWQGKDWVLSCFSETDQKMTVEAIARAVQAASCWCDKGIAAVMNEFNSTAIKEQKPVQVNCVSEEIL